MTVLLNSWTEGGACGPRPVAELMVPLVGAGVEAGAADSPGIGGTEAQLPSSQETNTTAWPVLDALRISPSGSSTLIEDRRPKIEDSRSGNAVPGIGTGGLRGPNRHRGLARAWGLLDDASLRGEVPDAAPRPGSPLGAAPHRSGP